MNLQRFIKRGRVQRGSISFQSLFHIGIGLHLDVLQEGDTYQGGQTADVRSIATLLFALSFALAGCSAASVPAPQTQQLDDPTIDFPGDHLVGKAAMYRVITGTDDEGTSVMELMPTDVTSSLSNVTPLAGAVVHYPDDSTQTTGNDGTFDASRSSYAAVHPENITDPGIQVIVEPPTGASLTPIAASIIAPSPQDEGLMESGEIPDGSGGPAQPGAERRSPQAYVWSCNGNDYEYGVNHLKYGLIPTLNPYKREYDDVREIQVAFITYAVHSWYTGHAYRCGTDQPESRVKTRTTWWRIKNEPYVAWQVWVEIVDTKTKDAVPYAAVWAQPDNYFFSFNRHLQLVCPYYYKPPSIAPGGGLDPGQSAGCL